MLRNLLAERFKLAAHFEKKEMAIYQLTVARVDSGNDPTARLLAARRLLVGVVRSITVAARTWGRRAYNRFVRCSAFLLIAGALCAARPKAAEGTRGR
jgi:hypothetical protein